MYEIMITMIREAVALPIQPTITKRSIRAVEVQAQTKMMYWWSAVQDAATAEAMTKDEETAL